MVPIWEVTLDDSLALNRRISSNAAAISSGWCRDLTLSYDALLSFQMILPLSEFWP